MTIVLNHVQRLVLRRLAASPVALRFIQIVPNRSNHVRREYRVAVDSLESLGFIALAVGSDAYFITMLGRRELYPRASRDNT